MTEFIHKLSVAVPVSLTEQANHLAAYLGGTEADLQTYTTARYTKGADHYHFLATVVTDTALQRVQTPSDIPGYVDSALLQQALGAIVVSFGEVSEGAAATYPSARPDKITAVIGLDTDQALSVFGLTINADESMEAP